MKPAILSAVLLVGCAYGGVSVPTEQVVADDGGTNTDYSYDPIVKTEHKYNIADIGFRIEYQEMNSWCWVAGAVSISAYYGSTLYTQCDLITTQLDVGSCCPINTEVEYPNPYMIEARDAFQKLDIPLPLGCNHGGDFVKAIVKIGAAKPIEKDVSWFGTISNITTELGNGHPIEVAIAWNNGGAEHTVVIGGYDNGNLLIHDPTYGMHLVSYPLFPSSYMGGAELIAVVLTRPLTTKQSSL